MKVQIRPRGPSSVKLKFSLGIPGPETEWRVNPSTSRFEYRPKGSALPWTEAPGSEFAGLVGGLTTEQLNFTAGITGALTRGVDKKLGDIVSLRDFGGVADYDPVTDTGTDNTAALNAMWAAIRSSFVTQSTNGSRVTLSVIIPPGQYLTLSSVNWTDLRTRNVSVIADGAVIVSKAANKPAIDITNVRGLRLKGLSVYGHMSAMPSCGILVGPAGTATCGNNQFTDVQTFGFYTKASFANVGSETTYYWNCYFINESDAVGAYAYAADGVNRLGFTSDFSTLRAANAAVSFTCNAFYACHFRQFITGDCFYGEALGGWMWDPACYFLTLDGSSLVLRTGTTYRLNNLKINGLFEADGMKHVVRFITDAQSTSSAIPGFQLDTNSSRASVSVMKIEDLGGNDLTTGYVHLRNAVLRVNGTLNTGGVVPMFGGAGWKFRGDIHCGVGEMLNLDKVSVLHGNIYTDRFADITLPATSSSSAFTVYDEESSQGLFLRMAGPGAGHVGIQGASTHPLIRAENDTLTDVDLRLQGKGAGLIRFGTKVTNADAAITGYITVKDFAGNLRKLALID